MHATRAIRGHRPREQAGRCGSCFLSSTRGPDRRGVALDGAWSELGGVQQIGGLSFGSVRGAARAPMVELEWSCPPAERQGEGPAEAAAVRDAFRLSDIGCPVDWPQLFTLGIDDAAADSSIWIATWGSPEARKGSPLLKGPGGYRGFRFTQGGLVVAGRVVSRDARHATLALDEVSWRGVGVCDPGVYGVPLAPRTGTREDLAAPVGERGP